MGVDQMKLSTSWLHRWKEACLMFSLSSTLAQKMLPWWKQQSSRHHGLFPYNSGLRTSEGSLLVCKSLTGLPETSWVCSWWTELSILSLIRDFSHTKNGENQLRVSTESLCHPQSSPCRRPWKMEKLIRCGDLRGALFWMSMFLIVIISYFWIKMNKEHWW